MYENQEEQVNLPACAVILMTLFPFIKQNYERFKLAEFLSEKKPTQRDIVENQFKECIHSIISWKSKNKISDWAIDQKKHGYPVCSFLLLVSSCSVNYVLGLIYGKG